VPARPYKPKDKAKAEVGVQIVERWIMARLRNETFFSLRQLNLKIQALLVDLNQRKMKKHPGSRLSQFDAIDRPALKPLPTQPYSYTLVKQVSVHIDYHVEIEKHYYSVPHTLIKQKLEAHASGKLVTLYHQGIQVAVHPRSYREGAHTTLDLHMPIAHQKQQQWTPQRFERWASKFGTSTEQFVMQLMQAKKHPEQSYRACMGLLSLGKKFSDQRLEAACHRALTTGVTRVKQVKTILEKGLDKQPLPQAQGDLLQDIDHKNIRGNHYYH
jgi:transposase